MIPIAKISLKLSIYKSPLNLAPQKKGLYLKWVIIFTISSIEGRWEGSLDQQRVIRLSMGLGKFFDQWWSIA